MADIQALEQRLEGISVQDENQDANAHGAAQKSKVRKSDDKPDDHGNC